MAGVCCAAATTMNVIVLLFGPAFSVTEAVWEPMLSVEGTMNCNDRDEMYVVGTCVPSMTMIEF